MSELLIDIFGKPHGIIIFQLVAATRFTIYLSLVAFGGGGVVAAMITFLTVFLPVRKPRLSVKRFVVGKLLLNRSRVWQFFFKK